VSLSRGELSKVRAMLKWGKRPLQFLEIEGTREAGGAREPPRLYMQDNKRQNYLIGIFV
jgi:hypothetical protein